MSNFKHKHRCQKLHVHCSLFNPFWPLSIINTKTLPTRTFNNISPHIKHYTQSHRMQFKKYIYYDTFTTHLKIFMSNIIIFSIRLTATRHTHFTLNSQRSDQNVTWHKMQSNEIRSVSNDHVHCVAYTLF